MQQINFGYIRGVIISQINESVSNNLKIYGNNLKEFKKLVSEDSILNLENIFYNNIEYAVIDNTEVASRHINNTLKLFEGISFEDFVKSHNKLLIFKNTNDNVIVKNEKLYEAINNLISESIKDKIEFNPTNYSQSFEVVLNHIIKPKFKKTKVHETKKYDLNKFIEVVFEKFEEKYKDLLNESEIGVLKDLTFKNVDDKKILFENLKNGLVDNLNDKLNETLSEDEVNENGEKQTLIEAKAIMDSIKKIKKTEFDENNLIVEVSKLLDLKRSLN